MPEEDISTEEKAVETSRIITAEVETESEKVITEERAVETLMPEEASTEERAVNTNIIM